MKIAIVGEAWGADEEREGRPFVGASGRLLNAMLSQIGIARNECLVTNVFNLRPKPTNDIKNLCGPKKEGIPGLPYLVKGKFVRSEYAPEIERLHAEIREVKPNLILALGATAAWAFLGTSGIQRIRGATAMSPFGKVLPTYHPAAIMRDWSLRPIVLADFDKAKREAEFPEVRRPRREIWIEPTLNDLATFDALIRDELSFDIENIGECITCVGFAPSPALALVVPFFDQSKSDHNYWPSAAEERVAWDYVRRWCSMPITRRVGQNVLYDTNVLWRVMGIAAQPTDDTMLLHHALQPELEKGLGFLGTVYTDEASWKFMRHSATAKREE